MRTIVIVVCIFLSIGTIAQKSAWLEGTIEQATEEFVQIEYPIDMLSGEYDIFRALLDSAGGFVMPIKIQHPTIVRFIYGDHELPVFVSPEETVKLTFDGRYPFYQLQFEQSDGKMDNDCLQKYKNQYGYFDDKNFTFILPSLRILNKNYDIVTSRSTSSAFRYMGYQIQFEQDEVYACPNLSEAFRSYMKDFIVYNWRAYQVHFINPKALSYGMENDFLAVLSPSLLNQPDKLYHPSFCSYVDENILYLARAISGDNTLDYVKDWERIYHVVHDSIGGIDTLVRQFFLGRLLHANLRPANALDIEPLVLEYLEETPISPTRSTVEKKYRYTKKYANGSPAPLFQVVDTAGNEVDLESFRGKYVYLSFWAKWCSNCIDEMYSSKSNKFLLREEEDIVFLYVSVEESQETWKKHYATNDIKGVHLWIKGTSNQLATDYGLRSLPKYYFIDKEGNFIAPFTKVSDVAFVKYIKELLSVEE